MAKEDFDKELERLWARVASSNPSLPTPMISGAEFGAPPSMDFETMALIKRQHEAQARQWADMLEAKERSLKAALDRQRAMESELAGLRRRAETADDQVMDEVLSARSQLEAGIKALDADRARMEEDIRSNQALLQATRERLEREQASHKMEARYAQERERKLLAEIKLLEEERDRLREETGQTRSRLDGTEGTLKEAKNALEKTLAELLRERQVREDLDKERGRALQKVEETEAHFQELQKIWEEERGQWRELWDRERSTWETQRLEFSTWEDKLRKEREAWSTEIKADERRQAEFIGKITENLRESAEASRRVARVLKMLEGLGLVETRGAYGRKRFSRKALAFLIIPLLAYGGFWANKFHQAPKPKLISIQAVPLENPVSVAHDGSSLWLSEYDGHLLSFDPHDAAAAIRKERVAGLAPYHPSALAFDGESLWSADVAQARLVKHDPKVPGQVNLARPSPGPAPQALAYDGEALWSYDSASRALYRHAKDGSAGKGYVLPGGMIPTAMGWTMGKLWVFEPKSQVLVLYAFKDDKFKEDWRVKLGEPALGLAFAPVAAGQKTIREFWALLGPAQGRSGYALSHYGY